MLKVIIAGSRDFNDFQLLKSKLDFYFQRYQASEIEIVSGTARGADRLGEQYAIAKKFSVKRFPAQWDVYGKSAGYRRNEQMAEYATHCICFWDGVSRGTKHMIDIAKKQNLNLRVVKI